MKTTISQRNGLGTQDSPIKMMAIKDTIFAMDEGFLKETEKAYFFNVMNTSCGSNKNYWIPKSLLNRDGDFWVLPTWFIEKNFSWIK